MTHVEKYFQLISEIAQNLNLASIEKMALELKALRERNGRLFILGVGGSAGNASHAACDFRKLCNIETYAPTDNISELTARTNDEGWNTVFSSWLRTSKANENDAVLVFSVGGGNLEKNVSTNLIEALQEAQKRLITILGIVGRDGGYTAKVANHVIIVPPLDTGLVTFLSEAYQSVIWHCLVSNPLLQVNNPKW